MEEENDIKKLQRSLETLQSDIQRLASPYEDALSHRVFDSTKKKIYTYFGAWASIITVLIAFFGFNAYDKIVSGTTDIAIKDFVEKVKPELKKNAEDYIQKEIKSITNEKLKTYSLDVQTKVDAQLSQVIKTSQNQSDIKLNQALKEIGTKLNDNHFVQQTQNSIDIAVKNEQSRTGADGWSFYGVLNSDGKWRSRAFLMDNKSKNDTDYKPSKNDKIKATTDVNIRSDSPTYTESDGWSYPPIDAIVSYGEIVTVQNIK